MKANILIVEDEEALTLLLRYNLEAEGYGVETVPRGDEADLLLKERAPDLVILDWMLPGLSGIELCRRLRARPETKQLPIIMLTARGEESERVRGLATGADDYIVKPFSVPELSARVRALLRRALPERLADVLSFGDLEVDREKKRVSRGGRPIDLGPTEYRLLEFLMERPGRVFSREQLLDGVWGSEIISTSAPSTSMLGACARRSTAATRPTRSAPSAARVTRWTTGSGRWPESEPSLPGLTRQSIAFAGRLFAKKMDARVKPGHDERWRTPTRGTAAGRGACWAAGKRRASEMRNRAGW